MKSFTGYRHIHNTEKLNVWIDILNNTLIGPYSIEGNLTQRNITI